MPPEPTAAAPTATIFQKQQHQQQQRTLPRCASDDTKRFSVLNSVNSAAAAASPATEDEARPIFTVGVITDIQYAPIPDGTSYGGKPRYYRHALVAAKQAAEHFQNDKVSLVLNLGDSIDGKCQMIEQEGGVALSDNGDDPGPACLKHVLEALLPYQHGPIIHTYGNHELYNLNREQIGTLLNIPFVKEGTTNELVGYRSHYHNGIRFVVLDTNDISYLRPPSSHKRRLAEATLAKENPDNYAAGNENSPENLVGNQMRFVAFNGGVDAPQLAWLHRTLQSARDNAERVVLLSHQPILPGSYCSPVTLVWNYNDVLQILRAYADVVVLSLAGHAHKGGYERDEMSGIHFRVVEAVLETPSPGATYAMMDVHDDKICLRGFGECESAEYDFGHIL